MNKRNVATLLWFLMGWSLALVLAAFAGLPSILAPVLAIGLGRLSGGTRITFYGRRPQLRGGSGR